MFCPKCGSQNADGTKYCRGCGSDVSNVLAALVTQATSVSGMGRSSPPATTGIPYAAGGMESRTLAEKYIELYSLGIKGLLLGIGFLIISGVVYTLLPQIIYALFFSLTFAALFLSTSVSRFVQARGIKALSKRDEPAALPPGQTEYIKPSGSIYETDDLARQPLSVTEHTTRHLKSDE